MSVLARIPIPDEAEAKLPPQTPDGSGVGVNYADALGRCFTGALPDGRALGWKRRGIELTLTLGDQSARTLLDRWGDGPDPRAIVHRALERLGEPLGLRLYIDNREIVIES